MALFTTEESPAAEYRKTLAQPEKKKLQEQDESGIDSSWLENSRHSILMYGQPKVGKTWAYCSIIADAAKKDRTVFVINTDAGLAETFKAYFKTTYAEVSKNVKYFFCKSTKEAVKATHHIIAQAQKEDWVIIDLLSDFWTMAQDEFLDAIGISPDQYIQLASKDASKFGLYDGNKWTYIKKLDNQISDILPKRGQYNVLGVCGSSDIKVEKIRGHQNIHEYDAIGERPMGQKKLPYNFDTILYVGGRTKRFFKIFGSRGRRASMEEIYYGEHFWPKYLETIKNM